MAYQGQSAAEPKMERETHRVCRKCGHRKLIEAFGQYYNGSQRWICQECRRESARKKHTEWRNANREHIREYTREAMRRFRSDPTTRPIYNEKMRVKANERRARLKAAVYLGYGGAKCACCGEAEPKFLTIDHVNNDGYTMRKNGYPIGGQEGLMKAILKAGCPPEFQILCMNCNFGKARNGGVCPHQDGKVQRLGRKPVGSSEPKHPALLNGGEDIV